MKEDFYPLLKTKQIIRTIIDIPVSLIRDIRSGVFILGATRKVPKKGKIRVAFIVQMPEIWDKEESVFEVMRKDSRFEAVLLVVPPFDRVKEIVTNEYEKNFFIRKYGSYAIPAFDGEKCIDLRNKFDYIFFQRPYDHYLPKELQSSRVVKVAKCCYIPYGFSGADVFNGGNTDKNFFRNMYFSFLESDEMVTLLKRKFILTSNYHHVENLGYPALELYYSINSRKKYEKILWTPRWSFDEKYGGSTFLDNYLIPLEIKQENERCDITFRPHPLLFGELISKKLMTKEEIDSYLRCLEQKGIRYDEGKPIFDTFCESDILITDFSTIIIQFFLTGKPVIYCDAGIVLNNLFSKMAEGFYIAHDKEEIRKYVKELQRGNDYLYEKRQEIIHKHLNYHMGSTQRIVEKIYNDAMGDKKK